MRTIGVNVASSIVNSSCLNRLCHSHASRVRRSISDARSARAKTTPPCYIKCIVRLYLRPAASMTKSEVRGAWFGVRSSSFSVSIGETVGPAASKTANTIVIIFVRP